MVDFYDWQKTFSYDADVTMVVGARGVGKTYGLRTQFIRDFLKDGSRFVELTRYKNELFGVANGYFDRVGKQEEFKDYEFRTNTNTAQIHKKGDTDEKGKADWQTIGYFIALTEAQQKKKRTYDNVRRILLDEAIIERTDRYHTYLPNEFGVLANVVDTVSRERADTEGIRPRVYLLGNAVDIANPYFAAYHVSTKMEFGYRWFANKTFLLHYVKDTEYAHEKLTGTVAGRMMAGTQEGASAANNEFYTESLEFVEKKPSRARFMFGLIMNGEKYGIWCDQKEGLFYVNQKIPRNMEGKTFSLTRSDSSVNTIAARRADNVMRSFSEMWYIGLIRYETVDVKTKFAEVLEMFGIR
jgi:hypothetical protein